LGILAEADGALRPENPLRRRPYAVKAARTVTTGGMERRVVRYRALSLPTNVESTFSMIKAKFRDHVRSKTDVAMTNEVLCKIICHNICCLIQAMYELGIEPAFWKTDAAESVIRI
jgi:hypothetical protein